MSEGRPYVKFDDGFVLTADSRQWVTGLEKQYDSGEKEGQTYLTEKRYHLQLSDALITLTERRLQRTEAETLDKLLRTYEQFAMEIEEAFDA